MAQCSAPDVLHLASEMLSTAKLLLSSGGGGKLAGLLAQKSREIAEDLVGKEGSAHAKEIVGQTRGLLEEIESGVGDAESSGAVRKGTYVAVAHT
jgi:hypothetical protein